MTDDMPVQIEAVTPRPGAGPVQVVSIRIPTLLDGPELEDLRQRVEGLLAAQPRTDLLIDLEPVRMLSSAAIGLLGKIHRQAWGSKGRLKICGVGPAVMQVFKVTRLDTVFDIKGTRAEALNSF